MQHALLGLAENPALPPELIDRLISTADADLAEALAVRPDLDDTQMATLIASGLLRTARPRGAPDGLANVDPNGAAGGGARPARRTFWQAGVGVPTHR